MDEWWTYELRDLILFTSDTYYRLIELYNTAVWPIQILAILLAIALLYCVLKRPPNHGKLVTAILAISWLWVAWAFLWQRFAAIHWIASYYAITFVIQACLLLWYGFIKDRFALQAPTSLSQKLGLTVLLYAIIAHPFVMIFTGNSWKQAELFALAPDTTVMATIGLLLLTAGRRKLWLVIIPMIWCVVSAATLFVLHSASASGLAVVILATLMALILRKYYPATN